MNQQHIIKSEPQLALMTMDDRNVQSITENKLLSELSKEQVRGQNNTTTNNNFKKSSKVMDIIICGVQLWRKETQAADWVLITINLTNLVIRGYDLTFNNPANFETIHAGYQCQRRRGQQQAYKITNQTVITYDSQFFYIKQANDLNEFRIRFQPPGMVTFYWRLIELKVIVTYIGINEIGFTPFHYLQHLLQ